MAALATATMVSQLQVGMSAVALVLYVHHATDSFAAAGVVAGAFTVGLGLIGPCDTTRARSRNYVAPEPEALAPELAVIREFSKRIKGYQR